MPETQNDMKLVCSPDLVSTDMDDEVVMMSIEKGEYYGIGGVGSHVWSLLQNPITMNEIMETVCPEYEVSEKTCRSEIETFIDELIKKGLVVTC